MERLVRGHGDQEAARQLGVSISTLRRWRRFYRIPPRTPTTRHGRQRQVILGLYRDGWGAQEIGRRLGLDRAEVLRELRAAGEPRRRAGRPVTRPAPPRDELAAAYTELGTIARVAAHYKVGDSTAHRWLRAAGVQLRPQRPLQGGGRTVPPPPEDLLRELHHRYRVSVSELARRFDAAPVTVRRWLRAAGIAEIDPRTTRGARDAVLRTSSDRRACGPA